MKEAWIELANGDESVNRFFATILGYSIAALVVTIYLNVLSVGSVQNAGRAVRIAIKQQLVVLKVTTDYCNNLLRTSHLTCFRSLCSLS